MKPYLKRLLFILILALIGAAALRFDPDGTVFNVPGLLVVVVGTFVATILGQSLRVVLDLLTRLPGKLAGIAPVDPADLDLFMKVSEMHRQGTIRYAEAVAKQIADPFLRSGVMQVLDRMPYADVSRVLQWKIGAQRERDQAEIQVFTTMMSFAPAFGMLGTLFGLITMLYELDMSSLRHLGQSMGFAMLTTVYGLLLANLVFKPIVSRLEQRSRERLSWLHVQQEAILMMHEKCHPHLVKEYLDAYLGPAEVPPQYGDMTPDAVYPTH